MPNGNAHNGIQTTSEKGFLDALRDGLNYIDENGGHIAKNRNKSDASTVGVPTPLTTYTTTPESNKAPVGDDEEFSLLDLILGDEKLFTSPGEDSNLTAEGSWAPTAAASPTAAPPTNSLMRIRPVMPEHMKNESVKFALLPMSLYNMVSDEGTIVFEQKNMTMNSANGSARPTSTNLTEIIMAEVSANASTEQSIEFEVDMTTYVPSVDTTIEPADDLASSEEVEVTTSDEAYDDGDSTEVYDESTIVAGDSEESTAATISVEVSTARNNEKVSSTVTPSTSTTTTTKTTTIAAKSSTAFSTTKLHSTTSAPAMRIGTTTPKPAAITTVKLITKKAEAKPPQLAQRIMSSTPKSVTTKVTTPRATSKTSTPISKRPVLQNKESETSDDDDSSSGSVFSAFLEGFSSALLKANFSHISDKLDIKQSISHAQKFTTPKVPGKTTVQSTMRTTTEEEEVEIITIRPTTLRTVLSTKKVPKFNQTQKIGTNSIRLPLPTHPAKPHHRIEKPVIIDSNPSILDVDINYDYDEPTLPPSLPNLKIIPFLPTDAVKVIPKGGSGGPDKHKYEYYQPPLLIENKPQPPPPSYLDKYPVYSVDSTIDDRIDYDVYKPEHENKGPPPPPYGSAFSSAGNKVMPSVSVNVNSKIDFEMFDHTAYPPITKDPHSVDKNTVDRYPYDNTYDYDTYNLPPPQKIRPNFDLKKNNVDINSQRPPVSSQGYHVPEFVTLPNIELKNAAAFIEAEHKTENPINKNQFSPPNRTEGNVI